MYALIVFTLGWPAPEPVGTFSRIEVCQATKVMMADALTDIASAPNSAPRRFQEING